MLRHLTLLVFSCCLLSCKSTAPQPTLPGHTIVSILGDAIHINGKPTYAGRYWGGHKIEGLLFDSRMVQSFFDHLNTETRPQFNYSDTDTWKPDRNTDEFIAAMPSWLDHGVLGATINLQGGSPNG